MVKSKTELFEPGMQESAALFKALSHPARIAILKYLAGIQACVTGDISDELPLGRTTVNQHLDELKKAGFIKGQIEGSRTKYCLNPEKISSIRALAEDFFDEIDRDTHTNC